MIKHLNLTEDHLKLIPFLLIEENDENVTINKHVALSIQSHLLDDVSLILGLRDKAIPNTLNDAEGMAFPDDIEEYMIQTYNYIVNNLYNIETLIHQFVTKGGISVGHYFCNDVDNIWSKEEI